MNATRLTTALAVVALMGGILLISESQSLWLSAVGAFLIAGAALLFSRHLWREADKRGKRESAHLERVIARSTQSIEASVADVRRDMAGGFDSTTKRIDIFTKGVLEYMAQYEDEIAVQKKLLRELQGNSYTKEALARRLELMEDRRRRDGETLLRQLNGLAAVYSVLKPTTPYPDFGGWAIGADSARLLINRILESRPRRVLEIGGGLSTVLIAQTLELIGEEGTVTSLEHDNMWLEETFRLVRQHGMEHRVRLVHAPLVTFELGDEDYKWYDFRSADISGPVQLIFVDGPPKATGPMARYPALPLLHDLMDSPGILLMDDAGREDERDATIRWKSEFPDLTFVVHKDTKGTVEIIKSPA